MQTAVIYARYSSDKQRAESIEQQVDVCSAYAEREGYVVTQVYTDKAVSGRTDRRDGFLQMVDDAKLKTFEAVIVYKLDRFARNRYDAAMYRHKLRECGVRVVSAMEQIPDTPEGRLQEALMEGVAEWYSADLSQKVMRGMYANAEKCLVNGNAVFGYATGEDGRYIVNDEQARWVRTMFTMWVDGYNAHEICDKLNAFGMLTQAKRRPTPAWVLRALKNERYTGVYIWGEVRKPGGMPQIITEELFHRAQSMTRPSEITRKRNAYPLVGKLFDAETGKPMCGTSSRGRNGDIYTYYAVKQGGKVVHRVRAEAIEDATVAAITSLMKDAATVDDVVRQVLKVYERKLAESSPSEAEQRLKELKGEEERITLAIRQGVALDTIIESAKALEREIHIAKAAVEAEKRTHIDAKVLRSVIQNLQQHASVDAIIENMVETVMVYRCEGIVVVTLPIVKTGTTETYQNQTSDVFFSRSNWWSNCNSVRNNEVNTTILNGALVLCVKLAA